MKATRSKAALETATIIAVTMALVAVSIAGWVSGA